MTGYVLQRLFALAPLLLAVALVTFLLMHAVPGGPWDAKGRIVRPELAATLDARYGLDDPLWEQFGRFLAGALQGDLGVSFRQVGRPVGDILVEGLKVSAVLGALAFGFAFLAGGALGVAAALRPNSLLNHGATAAAAVGAGTPSFVLGILLIVVFSVQLEWLPVFGWGSWRQAVLPTVSLGALPAAFLARIIRASLLEVLGEDFVRTARAKGLPERVVLARHVARAAAVPALTVAGPIAAGLVAGSFIVETVFAIPGLGKQFVDAVFQRDYGVVMGITLFYAALIAVANLGVDLAYAALDPRLRPWRSL